jgi:uncharacterized RDD family membrane protein YckC
VISIGRDPSNDLVLSDSMVSRRHAILEQRENQFVLRDNNSSNGTMVNGDRVQNEKALRDGDLVAIGSSRLLFQLDDTGEASLPPRIPAPDPLGATPSAGVEVSKAAEEARCGNCAKPVSSKDRFCRACGHDLTRDGKSATCSKCGTDVPLPADFCGQCGTALAEKPASGGLDKGAMLSTRPHRRSDLEAELAKITPPEPAPPAAPARSRSRSPGAASKPQSAKEEAAGFGIRFLALLVDEIILGIPLLLGGLLFLAPAVTGSSTPLTPTILGTASMGYSVLCSLYFILFWGARGTTPGKSLLGLVIQTDAGETPIGYSRALLRLLGYALSAALLGAGFLLILLSEDRRGLHDRIAGTRVTRVS